MSLDVQVVLNGLRLDRNIAEFKVSEDGKRVGTLKVRTGSIVWVPYDRTYGFIVPWSGVNGLNELMSAFGTREMTITDKKRNGKPKKKNAVAGTPEAKKVDRPRLIKRKKREPVLELVPTPQAVEPEPVKYIRITDEDVTVEAEKPKTRTARS